MAQAAEAPDALQVHVIAYKRPESLARLLSSLRAAHYDGDKVDLHLHVDAAATAAESDRVARVRQIANAEQASWRFGAVTVDDLRDAASAALEADDAALSAARAAAADDDAAAAEDAEIAATVPPTPHNSLTALDEADETDGERTATPADLCALDPDALERTASPADLAALDAPPPAAFLPPPTTDVATLAQLQRDMDSDDAAPAQIAEPPGR